jgi:hypothetical protein
MPIDPQLPAGFDPEAIPEYPGPGGPHDERGMDVAADLHAAVVAAEAEAAAKGEQTEPG